MKIVVCDITGRTLNYDVALCEAINKQLKNVDHIELWSNSHKRYNVQSKRFYSLVPNKYRNSPKTVIRILKAFDTFMAYLTIIVRVIISKPDVFHLQWFPFLSLGVKGSSIDVLFIKTFRFFSPQTRLVYTIHNICPHSMKEQERKNYNPVFTNALKLFDHYVVHTFKTKEDVIHDLGLSRDKVTTIYHGIFIPNNYSFSSPVITKSKLRIIMYGNQNWYKGTDVLVDSLSNMDEAMRDRCTITICGDISKNYLEELQAKPFGHFIKWIPHFVEDGELYRLIDGSDVIVLPYRRISQSGVLLLALSTDRLIITSDLETFKETLNGLGDELFFKSEDPKDLARIIMAYINNEIDRVSVLKKLRVLRNLYSWGESAKATICLYKELSHA